MYYSYFLSEGTSYTCDDLGGERQNLDCKLACEFPGSFECNLDCDAAACPWLDCNSPCNAVIDTAFTIEASDSGSKNIDGLFDYNFSPASLVPLSVRLSFLQAELERYGVPRAALTAQTASQFVVDMFEEYMGCAVSRALTVVVSFVTLFSLLPKGWHCGKFILQVSK